MLCTYAKAWCQIWKTANKKWTNKTQIIGILWSDVAKVSNRLNKITIQIVIFVSNFTYMRLYVYLMSCFILVDEYTRGRIHTNTKHQV